MAIVTLSGVALGADPEVKGDKHNVLTISVAENYYDPNADDKRGTKWHNIAIFNPESHMWKFVQEHVKKGSFINVACKQGYSKFTYYDKEGKEKVMQLPNLHAIDIEFAGSGKKKDKDGDSSTSNDDAPKAKNWKAFAEEAAETE